MPDNYSFVIEGKLAASARPGSWDDLRQDLQRLKADGVDTVVSLTEEGLDAKELAAAGLAGEHLPVRDFQGPSLEQIGRFCDIVRQHLDDDRGAVLVHCGAGIGRTGTMLSAWFIDQGMGVEEAIRHVRRVRPGSIETPSQVEALRKWEAQRRKARHDGQA